MYTGDVDWRTVDTLPSPRVVRVAVPRIFVLFPVVAARATTLRVVVYVRPEDAFVAARAVLLGVPAERADTVRVATRRVPPVPDGVVAARAVADVVAVPRRGTTLRVDVLVDLVRARTFIWALDCVGFVPGFKLVRIVLFIYGYRLLYAFSLI